MAEKTRLDHVLVLRCEPVVHQRQVLQLEVMRQREVVVHDVFEARAGAAVALTRALESSIDALVAGDFLTSSDAAAGDALPHAIDGLGVGVEVATVARVLERTQTNHPASTDVVAIEPLAVRVHVGAPFRNDL